MEPNALFFDAKCFYGLIFLLFLVVENNAVSRTLITRSFAVLLIVMLSPPHVYTAN